MAAAVAVGSCPHCRAGFHDPVAKICWSCGQELIITPPSPPPSSPATKPDVVTKDDLKNSLIDLGAKLDEVVTAVKGGSSATDLTAIKQAMTEVFGEVLGSIKPKTEEAIEPERGDPEFREEANDLNNEIFARFWNSNRYWSAGEKSIFSKPRESCSQQEADIRRRFSRFTFRLACEILEKNLEGDQREQAIREALERLKARKDELFSTSAEPTNVADLADFVKQQMQG